MEVQPRYPAFEVDRASAKRLSDLFGEGLRKAIVSGFYKAGDVLPARDKLAVHYGVSETVVRTALRQLMAENLLVSRPKIGCMVLGSWAYPQMQEAGPNPDDIGYMSFPITVNGKQYATAGADYCFGINVKASDDQKLAAMYYIKWLTEESNFSYDEGGVPILKDGEYPALYAAFAGIDMVADAPAMAGEEALLNDLNGESLLAINAGGNTKIQEIVEHAFNGDKEFDEIMADWNEAWSDAQEALNVEVNK